MNQSGKAILLALFVLVNLLPVLIMVVARQPAGRQWWRDLSAALGFLGLALMGWQFVPMARIAYLTDTFGRRPLLKFHIDLSLVAFYLVLAHPILLVLGNPRFLVTFNPFGGVWRMLTGLIALVLTIVIVATCVWRAQLKMKRTPWIWLHDVIAVAIMGFSLHHILGVNYFTSLPLQRFLWIVWTAVWALLLVYTRVRAARD